MTKLCLKSTVKLQYTENFFSAVIHENGKCIQFCNLLRIIFLGGGEG